MSNSTPPPYDGNSDRRPLPAGWISQYDPNYKAWFYVNTEAKPPTTTWIHPSGPVSTPSPEPRYSPPPMAPRVNSSSNYAGDYNQTRSGGQGGYPGYGGANNNYGDPRSEYGAEGYEQNYPQQRGLGGLLGRLTGGGRGLGDRIGDRIGHRGGPLFNRGRGRFGGGGNMDDGYMGDGYRGDGYRGEEYRGEEYMGDGYMGDRYRPQPQVVYVEQQQPPKKSGGIGMGGLALGAGAGLLGGVLLGEELDDNRDDNRDDGRCDDGGDWDNGDGGGGW